MRAVGFGCDLIRNANLSVYTCRMAGLGASDVGDLLFTLVGDGTMITGTHSLGEVMSRDPP